jgi:hypothetical protein
VAGAGDLSRADLAPKGTLMQLVVYTTPETAEVSLRHDAGGGVSWPGVPGTYQGRQHAITI